MIICRNICLNSCCDFCRDDNLTSPTLSSRTLIRLKRPNLLRDDSLAPATLSS